MKAKIITGLTLLIATFVMLFSASALALDCNACSGQSNLSTSEAIQCGTNCAAGNNQTGAQATTNANTTVSSLINILSLAVGAIAVIMVIIGGFRYITSAGKQETVTGAKNTILYAVVGLIIVALAQLIVHFVLNKTNEAITDNGTSNSTGSTGNSLSPVQGSHGVNP